VKALRGVELKRYLRQQKKNYSPATDLKILLQSVEYPYNVGAIFRLADGAGITELILSGITPTPPNPTIKKVGRMKSDSVRWCFERDPVAALKGVKQAGYQMVALEITDSAVPYYEFQYANKVCLVAGHEDHGLTKATLSVCDTAVFIPMYGKGRSHNVHTALSIVVYHILHQAIR
jgi:tRNA (guanosine-2'-O-)-methyltransferase